MTTTSKNTGRELWTVDFVLNILSGHLMFVSYTSLLTILPAYIMHRGGQPWQLGLIIGSMAITGVITRPFTGKFIVKYGSKTMSMIGSFILGLGAILFIPGFSPWLILPGRLIQGIGMAMSPVAAQTIVANLAPDARRAEAMSYMGNAINMTYFYAPLTASLITTYGGYHNAFLFAGLAGFAATITAWCISSKEIDTVHTELVETTIDNGEPEKETEKVPFISKGAIFPTFIFMAYTFTTAPINTFLPILAHQQKLGDPGLFFTVFSGSCVLTMLVSGRIADKFGRSVVIIPGLLATALSMFILNAAFFPFMLWTSGFFAGIAFGCLQPGTMALTVDRVPPKERGAAMGTLQQAWDVGGSGGALAIGSVETYVGAANTFGLAGIGAIIGTIAFVLGSNKEKYLKRLAVSATPQIVPEKN